MVSDDGGGFEESRLTVNQLANISNQQAYAAISSKAEGLGLGLMICQRLCKSLGGMMQLSNIDVQQEFADMQKLDTCYQLRLKRSSLNGEMQLSKTVNVHTIKNRVGAQVTIYLPLKLVDHNNGVTENHE